MKRIFTLRGVRRSMSVGAILLTGQFGYGQSSTPANSGASSDQVRNSPLSTRESETGPEADAPKTVYSKSGTGEKGEANPYGKSDGRGKINYGKNGERIIVTESSKPAAIRKTKYGSSDATESTGVFKQSFLDVGIDKSATIKAITAPKTDGAPKPQARPAVAPSVAPVPAAATQLDIKLGVNSAASPSPSP